MTLYAGIDPGTKGAIVIIDDSKTIIDKLPFMRKGGDSLVIEWECGVKMYDSNTLREFLSQYSIDSVAIECPRMTVGFAGGGKKSGATSLANIANLRGMVTQLHQLMDGMIDVRRLVDPVTWQAVNRIGKPADRTRDDAFKKHLIATFIERYPDHGCKYGYELEGVADAWFIARWGMIQSKLDMGEVA
jgi:hypothetical protein